MVMSDITVKPPQNVGIDIIRAYSNIVMLREYLITTHNHVFLEEIQDLKNPPQSVTKEQFEALMNKCRNNIK